MPLRDLNYFIADPAHREIFDPGKASSAEDNGPIAILSGLIHNGPGSALRPCNNLGAYMVARDA